MKSKPNCKINLGLHVVAKRADGYHNIETIFMPIGLCDELEIEKSSELRFWQEGIEVDCAAEENICIKAYRMMQQDFGQIGQITMNLRKNIPFGAGLGGGSSDGAFTIKMLNELYELGMSDDAMQQYAARLGADCTFFIGNQTSYAYGIGNKLEPIVGGKELMRQLSGKTLVVVKPEAKVSTADAYRGIVPKSPTVDLREAIRQPIEEWRNLIVNDFEKTVFAKYPEIETLKKELYNRGALYASMSGSGSALFALFDGNPMEEMPYEIYRCSGDYLLPYFG